MPFREILTYNIITLSQFLFLRYSCFFGAISLSLHSLSLVGTISMHKIRPLPSVLFGMKTRFSALVHV